VRHRRIAAPAIDFATGVDTNNVSFYQHTFARDAMHDLLIDRNASDGGKRSYSRIAFEQWNRAKLLKVPVNRGIDFSRRRAGPNELARDLMGLPDSETRLTHQTDFARRSKRSGAREMIG